MQRHAMEDGGRDSGNGRLEATGTLVNPPLETLASGVPICKVLLDIDEDVPLTAVARGDVSKKLSLMDSTKQLKLSGRLVLHNWRTGAATRNSCVLEIAEINYA